MRRALSLLIAAFAWSAPAFAADLIDFWNTPQRGANSFNDAPPDDAYFRALRGYGATWVRLSFSGWNSAETGREFLFGSLDDYRGLVACRPRDLSGGPRQCAGCWRQGGGHAAVVAGRAHETA